MVSVFVVFPARGQRCDVGCRQLAGACGKRQHLVAARLDRACLVRRDVASIGCDHALPRQKQGADRHGVCLRASDEEVHLGIGRVACLADQRPCPLAVCVGAVACVGLEVYLGKPRENRRVRALLVVGRKGELGGCGHGFSLDENRDGGLPRRPTITLCIVTYFLFMLCTMPTMAQSMPPIIHAIQKYLPRNPLPA